MVSSFSCARNIQHATVEQYNGASSCALQHEANTPRDTPRPSSIDRTKAHRPPSRICADSCSPVPGQVMPWVIADYQSAQLDLADKATCVSFAAMRRYMQMGGHGTPCPVARRVRTTLRRTRPHASNASGLAAVAAGHGFRECCFPFQKCSKGLSAPLCYFLRVFVDRRSRALLFPCASASAFVRKQRTARGAR